MDKKATEAAAGVCKQCGNTFHYMKRKEAKPRTLCSDDCRGDWLSKTMRKK